MRRHLLTIAATTVVVLLCAAPVAAQSRAIDPLDWVPSRIDTLFRSFPQGFRMDTATRLVFSNGVEFVTRLFDANYHGQLPSGGAKAPYLILSGHECTQCDAGRVIYFFSPTDSASFNPQWASKFKYPGEIADWESGEVAFRSRMFFGECLADPGPVAIWFQEERSDGDWTPSVYLARPRLNGVVGARIEVQYDLADVLARRAVSAVG